MRTSHINRYPTPARTYYVDATNGLDTNTGQADKPLQTVTAVNALALKPGDRVLFSRGETFTNALRPPKSGTPGRPIFLGDYGVGNKPIITSASGAIALSDRSWLVFNNIQLQGTGINIQFGAAAAYAKNILCYGLDCSGSSTNGIYMNGAGNVHDIHVEGCTVIGSAGTGVLLDGGPYNVVFRSVDAHNNGTPPDSSGLQHNFYINTNAFNVILQDCISYGSSSHGIQIKAYDCVIERCKIYSNAKQGILLQSQPVGANVIIRNNLIYSNTKTGIYLAATGRGNKIYNNTIVNNVTFGIYVDNADALGNLIKNNLVVQDFNVLGNAHNCIKTGGTAQTQGNTFNNNDYIYIDDPSATPCNVNGTEYTLAQWQALTGTPDANSISSDPVFVTDYTDLHLQVTSPCIAAGDATLGVLADYDSVVRGVAVDIGAHEYVA